MDIDDKCPCGSGDSFQDCCKPYLQNTKPASTAEVLMRSRYSAYVLNDMNYILNTWHPSTRPASLANDETHWLGLTIIDRQHGEPPYTDGTVEFIARHEHNGQFGQLHEVSRFQYENGRWYYCDGEIRDNANTNHKKIGRNQPCPCGSGLKYKKCCGRNE